MELTSSSVHKAALTCLCLKPSLQAPFPSLKYFWHHGMSVDMLTRHCCSPCLKHSASTHVKWHGGPRTEPYTIQYIQNCAKVMSHPLFLHIMPEKWEVDTPIYWNVQKWMEIQHLGQKQSLYNLNVIESQHLVSAILFFNTAWTLSDKLFCHFFK